MHHRRFGGTWTRHLKARSRFGYFRKPPVVYNFGTGYRLTYTRIYLRCSSLSSLERRVVCAVDLQHACDDGWHESCGTEKSLQAPYTRTAHCTSRKLDGPNVPNDIPNLDICSVSDTTYPHRRQSIRPDFSTPMPMSRCSTPRATPLAGYANASKRCTRKTLHGKDSVWTILRRSRVPTRGYEAVGRR